MTVVLALHVVPLTILLFARGLAPAHVAVDMAPIVAAMIGAASDRFGRLARTAAATLGLVTCSALLVHATDGLIESHFHFFAVIALVTLYQEWRPLVLAFLFVVVHHGLVGVLSPPSVYNHEAAWDRPVLWAFIHGGYVAVAALANVVAWRLNENERDRTERVLDATGEAIYGVDSDGRITFANPAMARLTGWSVPELENAHHHTLLDHADSHGRPLDADDCPVCRNIALADGESHEDELFSRRDGVRFPVEYSSHPIKTRAQSDGVAAVVNFQDITERRAFQQELNRQALHDSLTGLPNRILLLDRIGMALTALERSADAVAVIFCDLDRFKRINDSMGHDAGDALLRQFTARLSVSVRPGDTIARLGGDEFVICCPDIGDATNAQLIIERLMAQLQQPFDLGGATLHLQASFGLAVTSSSDIAPSELIRQADQAMYAAKNGGGGVRQYETTMAAMVSEQVFLEEQLREALSCDQLEMFYQPSIDLDTEHVVGVEALLRWNHPEHGVIGPDQFLPLAENTGLIIRIGRWVLEQTCRQITEWNTGREAPLTVGVNVSARQLGDAGFVHLVGQVLADTGCQPEWLLLEITERVLVAAIDKVAPALAELRDLGVRLALDDFGTGYSSLTYLRQLPVDVLKVDRSFVTGIGQHADHLSLVSAVVSMARLLSVCTIAEGVEQEDERAALSTIGLDGVQGYLFGRPQPAHVIESLLRKDAGSSYHQRATLVGIPQR